MLQVSQGEHIPITRTLEDPTDSDTNYVRVYIYKFKGSNAGVLLTTLNLTDKGSQKFETTYQAPADADDYFLEVIMKVFTDSNYTTESTRYARSQDKYLVAPRWGFQFGGGGGGGVNYDKIRNIIRGEVEKFPKPEKTSMSEKIEFSPLLQILKEVNKSIKEIAIVDFGPTIRAIEKVQNEIRAIRIPEPEKLNLFPVLNSLENVAKKIEGFLSSEISQVKEDLKKDIEGIIESFKKYKEKQVVFRIDTQEEKVETEQPQKKRRFL